MNHCYDQESQYGNFRRPVSPWKSGSNSPYFLVAYRVPGYCSTMFRPVAREKLSDRIRSPMMTGSHPRYSWMYPWSIYRLLRERSRGSCTYNQPGCPSCSMDARAPGRKGRRDIWTMRKNGKERSKLLPPSHRRLMEDSFFAMITHNAVNFGHGFQRHHKNWATPALRAYAMVQ